MTDAPIQDKYFDQFSTCYGCGRNNQHGLQIKSHLKDGILVCFWQPKDHHIAVPGYVNGGIIATIIDCHAVGMAMIHANQPSLGGEEHLPLIPYLTASLKIDYLKPTPLDGQPLELRASVKESSERKVLVECALLADNIQTVRGEVLAVRADNLYAAS